jgi:hypothetical protein
MNAFSKFVSLTVLACVASAAVVPTANAHSWQSHLSAAAQQSSTRGINGQCHVDSRVNSSVAVYINGIYRGTMGPSGDLYLSVRDFASETTYLRAVSADGRVWTQTVGGAFSNFTWTIY